MKPILFNTEMVRALMEGRKTVTRRVVNYTVNDVYDFACVNGMWHETYDPEKPPQKLVDRFVDDIARPPYRPGDILYVRETWGDGVTHYLYRADYPDGSTYIPKWRPSIHMPKEAARLFLRVTGVRAERLQDITSAGVSAEGTTGRFGATRGAFEILWDSTIKPADLGTYGWAANPWVWVVEFKRITKEEAENG